MSDTIKIEMDMPRPPEGLKYTGKTRPPNEGEYFWDWELGAARKANIDLAHDYPILERVPRPPEGFRYRGVTPPTVKALKSMLEQQTGYTQNATAEVMRLRAIIAKCQRCADSANAQAESEVE